MSKVKSFIFFAISLLFTLSVSVRPAMALTIPSFPSCSNPQGTLIVDYSTGTHGVAGDATTYTGSDRVYTVSEDAVTQCLCTDTGKGIQTNWWKISSITDEDLQTLKNLGWIFIPDGSAWGLNQGPYMALNSTFSCSSSTTTTSSDGGSVQSTTTSSSDPINTTPGQVLGLATTGNLQQIVFLTLAGIVLVIFGKRLQTSN